MPIAPARVARNVILGVKAQLRDPPAIGLEPSVRVVRAGPSTVSSAGSPNLHCEVVDEPIVRFDERRIEVLLGVVMEPAVGHFLNKIPVVKIPYFNQLTSVNVGVYADGTLHDNVGIEGELVR